jgi:hypothetical protein
MAVVRDFMGPFPVYIDPSLTTDVRDVLLTR